MNLLILGGTEFLGRHLVQLALGKGYQLTLLNRGQTNPHLFPRVETIQCDRYKSFPDFLDRSWDAVIDTSGYHPKVMRHSLEALARCVGNYIFISSISVYKDFSQWPITEDFEKVSLPDDKSDDDDSAQTYGARKYLCELEVKKVFSSQSCIVRPGLIVGPHDPTGRFSYWVMRVQQGGDMLVPAPKDRNVQFIDVRNLAEWVLQIAENCSRIL